MAAGTAFTRNGGGPGSHKPNCQCFACKNARKRAAAANPGPVGPAEAQTAPEVAAEPTATGLAPTMAPEAPRMPQEPTSPPKVKSTSAGRWAKLYAREQAENAKLPPLVAAPGRSARDRVALWMLMRTEDPSLSNADCARRMGLTPSGLGSILAKASKEGWLQFEDPLERIEHEIIPKTLDNLNMLLDQKSERTTLECAKGTAFPMFRESKGIEKAPQTVLAIKIEQAPVQPNGEVLVITDQIVGKPLTFRDDTEH